jgi:hypothetical protein
LKQTLRELQEKMTEQELLLWIAFFEIRHDEQKAQSEKSRRRR